MPFEARLEGHKYIHPDHKQLFELNSNIRTLRQNRLRLTIFPKMIKSL